MNTAFATFLIFGLIVSAVLMGWAFPNNSQNPYFNNVSNMYCSGYGSSNGSTCYSSNSTGQFDIWTMMLNNLQGWNLALSALVIAGLTIGVITGALNLIAIIPFALAFVVLNFLILPTGLITNTGLPEPIPMIIGMFFYFIALMAAISFTRTGQ